MISRRKKEVLSCFLDTWPPERVSGLSIDEYTGLEDKSTFCYAVEHLTRSLGTIRGIPSNKFGLFKWGDNFSKTGKKNYFDEVHAWSKKFGTDKEEAFSIVLKEVSLVIEAAQRCDLAEIESSPLNAWFKWKLASLYSEGHIPPIFKQPVINAIAHKYEIEKRRNEKSPVFEFIMRGIPSDVCRFEYVFRLYRLFNESETVEEREDVGNGSKLNKREQKRFLKKAVISIERRHDSIQEALCVLLKNKYSEDKVEPEVNWIDVRREGANEVVLYEIKTAISASLCIREALGQVLLYAHREKSPKLCKIVVVGEYEPTSADNNFIRYIKGNLNVNFKYIKVAI